MPGLCRPGRLTDDGRGVGSLSTHTPGRPLAAVTLPRGTGDPRGRSRAVALADGDRTRRMLRFRLAFHPSIYGKPARTTAVGRRGGVLGPCPGDCGAGAWLPPRYLLQDPLFSLMCSREADRPGRLQRGAGAHRTGVRGGTIAGLPVLGRPAWRQDAAKRSPPGGAGCRV